MASTDRPDLKTLVHTALDNAVENGYTNDCECGHLETVAINLIDYDADIGELHPDVMDVIPHIETWRTRRAN